MSLFSFKKFLDTFPKLLPYVETTVVTVIVTIIISFFLGGLVAACKLGKSKILRNFGHIYTEMIQGTPFLVLLFVVFYGIPMLIPQMYQWDKGVFLIIALILFSTSRMSETLRSAYEALDPSQMEAALSIGLTVPQALWHVLIPQALYIALPNIGNVVISALLETSLGFTIGQIDILGQAKLVNARAYGTYTLEVFMATAIIYWVLTMIIARLTRLLETILAKSSGRIQKVEEVKENAV